MEESLLLHVCLDKRDMLRAAPCKLEEPESLRIDREDAAGGAILGSHVGDGSAIGQRQRREPRTVELDELADDAMCAQNLCDGQHQVGCGCPFGEGAHQAEPYHARDQHRDRLSEHRGLRLDATDTPAKNAQAVDHRRMRIGADQRIGIGDGVASLFGGVIAAGEDHAREIFDIDLVDDTGLRGNHLEIS